jgi:hypothetical protein
VTESDQTDITLRELAAVAAVFTAATLVFTAPLVTRLGTALPAPNADPQLNAWILSWGAERLPYGFHGFWSPPIFYPYQNTLAYSENLLGIAVFVAPVYWVSRNPVLTYNVAFLLAYVMSALGAYVLARELTGRRDAALLAACAFAFAPYRWAQLPHLQVLSAGWLPVALWALHRAFRSPSWWVFALFAASFVLMAFSNGYAAYQTAFASGLVLCWSVVKHGVTRAQLWRMGAAAMIIGLLLAPAIVAHLRVWGDRELSSDIARFRIDLSTYLSVARELPGAGWLPGLVQSEGRLFPGVVVVLLALIALVPLGRRAPANAWRWTYVSVAILGALLSLGPRPRVWGWELTTFLPFYSWLLSAMPLFHALRVPARFGMLVLLAFSMLAAMGAARIMALVAPTAPWKRVAIALILALVIAWEGWGGPLRVQRDSFVWAKGDPAAYAWLARQPRTVLMDLPAFGLEVVWTKLKIQYAVLTHQQRTIGGVSRIETPLERLLAASASPLFDPALLPELVPFLRGLGVGHVLVRPAQFNDPRDASRLMNTFGTSQGSRQVAVFDDVVAYEITPGPTSEPGEAGLVKVPASSMQLSASRNGDRVSLAVDGDPQTRWLSGAPQVGKEWLEIAFDRPRDVARVQFVVSPRSLQDFPRRLEIVATAFSADAEQRILYSGSVLEKLGKGFVQSPELPTISIELPSHLSARLLIRQLGRAAPWYWSVDELLLWERPSGR